MDGKELLDAFCRIINIRIDVSFFYRFSLQGGKLSQYKKAKTWSNFIVLVATVLISFV